MKFQFNDGGRAAAGFKSKAKGDCGCRAATIATERPYLEIYALIQHFAKMERTGKRKRKISDPESGVYPNTMRKIMTALGWEWVPCMGIGTGCKVHLCADELPHGRVVVDVSHHFTTVVDGVINDLYDPSRGESRCVYGYFVPTEHALKPTDPLPFAIAAPRIAPRLLTPSGRVTIPQTKETRPEPRRARYDADGYRIMTAAEVRNEALALIPPEIRPYFTGIEVGANWSGPITAANSEIYLYFKAPVITALCDARYIHGALEDIHADLEETYLGDNTPDENADFEEYDAERKGLPVQTIRQPYTPYDRKKALARWTNRKRRG